MKVKVIGYVADMLSLPSEGLEVLLDEPISLGELTRRLWDLPFSMFTAAIIGDTMVSEQYELTGDEDEILLVSPVSGSNESNSHI
jgi:hypothetical protein